MAEFTDREKKIIHAMNIMNNPSFSSAPFELQTRALQSQFLMMNYQWDEAEMTDIMDAIGQEAKNANQSILKFLEKHGHHIKNLKNI